MKVRQAVSVLMLSVLLAACAGSSSGGVKSENRERAAELNLNLGIDYLRKGKLEEAKEKIERSLAQNPRSAKAQAIAGLLYDRINDQRLAESHFERAISLDPKDSEVANNYATYLCRKGKYEKGEKLALRAANDRLYKTPEFAQLNAGNCARGAGDLSRAEQHFRDALAIQPRLADALLQMAEIEYQREHFLPARGFIERYFAVQRASPGTLLLAVRIENSLGNRSGALTYSQRLKSEFPQAPETQELAAEKQRG